MNELVCEAFSGVTRQVFVVQVYLSVAWDHVKAVLRA
jgi:hypothetical protein